MYQYADLPTFSVAPTSQLTIYSAFRALFGNENSPSDLPDPSDEEEIDPQDDEMDDDLEAEIDPDFPDEIPDTNRPATYPQTPREIQL
jgi:hypothetical protein